MSSASSDAMQFWQGFAVAFVVIEMLALGVLQQVVAPAVAGMIRDFGAEGSVPATYQLVSGSAWQLGWLLGLPVAALAVGRWVPDPKRRAIGLTIVALVGAGVVVFTYAGLYGPIFATASQIQ